MKQMSTRELEIAERARKHKDVALTNLHEFIDFPMLKDCFEKLNKKSCPGVDNMTWQDYSQEAGNHLPELLSEFKNLKYRAPHIRRVHIPWQRRF
jgi:RNA-directed DNA polymerase